MFLRAFVLISFITNTLNVLQAQNASKSNLPTHKAWSIYGTSGGTNLLNLKGFGIGWVGNVGACYTLNHSTFHVGYTGNFLYKPKDQYYTATLLNIQSIGMGYTHHFLKNKKAFAGAELNYNIIDTYYFIDTRTTNLGATAGIGYNLFQGKKSTWSLLSNYNYLKANNINYSTVDYRLKYMFTFRSPKK